MAYEPTNWKAGDVVTSAKLNKMEQGIAGAGALVVHAVLVDGVKRLDKTWQEIWNAGSPFFICEAEEGEQMSSRSYEIGSIGFGFDSDVGQTIYAVNEMTYTTLDPDGYPESEGWG